MFVVVGCFRVAGNLVLSHQADDVKDRLDKLTQRWNEVCGGILERHRALKAASHHYGEFKVLTAQECDWQDKLEKKLLRSTTLAADAEEISEELDVSCFLDVSEMKSVKLKTIFCRIWRIT